MRVALLKAPRVPTFPFKENSESLALGYLASQLRARCHEALIINGALRNLSLSEIIAQVQDFGPEVIGLTVPDPTLVFPTLALLENLREAGITGHTVLGGHTATFHFHDLFKMSPYFDSVALYEGEFSFAELVESFERGGDCRSVSGLALRTADSFCTTESRAQVSNLDLLPFPARDDLPYVLTNLADVAAIPVLSSRGCYFRCSFCSVRSFYEIDNEPTWRRRTPENVLAEISDLHSRFGAKDILFVDDLFVSRSSHSRNYAQAFARVLSASRLPISFTISATADSIDLDTFSLLRECGLRQVYIGAESGSSRILKYLGKWFTPHHIEQAVTRLEALGINSSVSFINFTPATTLDELRVNLDFFSNLRVNLLQGLFNRYQVYGGTPLFQELTLKGTIKGSFPFFDYEEIDSRVGTVFEICRQALRPILELGVFVKRIERACSLSGRDLKIGEGSAFDNYNPSKRQELMSLIIKGINDEIRQIFCSIIDFVEAHPQAAKVDISDLISDLRVESARIAAGWNKTLLFFQNNLLGDPSERIHSPAILKS